MKWEGCDWSECSIGGGEGTNLSRVEDERMLWMLCRLGRRSPHPLPSSKPAGEQRGGEQPGRRSLEGVGGVQGFLGKFFGLLLFKEYILNFSCAVVWPAFANVPSFSRVDWGGTSWMRVKVFITVIVCIVVFYCQCLIRPGKRKYSRIKLRVNYEQPLNAVKDLTKSIQTLSIFGCKI
jgi:hypothetical protein